MSATATAWAWKAKLKHSPTKMVLLAYADAADDQNLTAMTRERLIELTELSETTVRKSAIDLVKTGYLEEVGDVIRQDAATGQNKLVSQYRVLVNATTYKAVLTDGVAVP